MPSGMHASSPSLARRAPETTGMVVFVASVLVGGVAFVGGAGSAYRYYQQGGCPSVLGWWDVEPALFRIAFVASLVGCAALWAS